MDKGRNRAQVLDAGPWARRRQAAGGNWDATAYLATKKPPRDGEGFQVPTGMSVAFKGFSAVASANGWATRRTGFEPATTGSTVRNSSN